MALDADFPEFDFDIFPRGVAPEANITGGNGQLLTGYINATYTSNLTIYFEPSTLPAPFPLVIVSSLVSLVCACYGWKTAVKTWATPGKRVRRDPAIAAMPYRERVRVAREALKTGNRRPGMIVEEVPLHPIAGPGVRYPGHEDEEDPYGSPPPYLAQPQKAKKETTEERDQRRDREFHRANDPDFIDQEPAEEVVAEEHEPEQFNAWDELNDPRSIHYIPPRTRVIVHITATFSCIRALIAFAVEMIVVVTEGTHAAPSSLFLLLLTLQTFISNRLLPLWLILLLVLSSALVATAFMMSIWDWSGSRYGQLYVEGGRCPMYASDCTKQVPQWDMIGCGASQPYVYDAIHPSYNNPNWGEPFYPPYGTQGDVNSDAGVLWIIESVVGGCGTFWAVPTVLATLWEASKLVRGALSWRELFHPVPERFIMSPTPPPPVQNRPGARKRWPRLGWGNVVACITIFGVLGSFVVTILSISGHAAAETIVHHAWYIDSLGPPVETNVTLDAQGQIAQTFYGGNATSWSDCFGVPTPTSGNGFFAQWVAHNEHVVFRLISLV